MDQLYGLDTQRADDVGADACAGDPTSSARGRGEAQVVHVVGDERRMHVRAYNHWVSLLNGRMLPVIGDLDPAALTDFGRNSVLLHFADGVEDPEIVFLGTDLTAECGLDAPPRRMKEVPGRSLLSRLTDHYLQIVANRAPVGFEAEFTSTRGHATLYRGILMPFAADEGEAISFVYGVISWKEMADDRTQAQLTVELSTAMEMDAPSAGGVAAAVPVWADGPGAGEGGALPYLLSAARESAAAAQAADARGRSALYRALGRAHAFARCAARDREGYAALLAEAGIRPQARAPMTAVAKLVFGADHDKTRLTEYAAVLASADRLGLGDGALPDWLASQPGGIKAVVAAERARRRPVGYLDNGPTPLTTRAAVARLALPSVPAGVAAGEAVLLVARMRGDGELDVLGTVSDPVVLRRATAFLR